MAVQVLVKLGAELNRARQQVVDLYASRRANLARRPG